MKYILQITNADDAFSLPKMYVFSGYKYTKTQQPMILSYYHQTFILYLGIENQCNRQFFNTQAESESYCRRAEEQQLNTDTVARKNISERLVNFVNQKYKEHVGT